jgi:hypothetical protein
MQSVLVASTEYRRTPPLAGDHVWQGGGPRWGHLKGPRFSQGLMVATGVDPSDLAAS